MALPPHFECTHPATKAARAKCRKDRAQYALDHAMELEYWRLEALTQARHAGRNGLMTTAMHALCAGAENADDTEGYERGTEAWYGLAIGGFYSIMDDTYGGDLRWMYNLEDCTPEEIENCTYNW
jgi:hypothetical protein